MRKVVYFSTLALVLCGCETPDIWLKSGLTQQGFNVDYANCQMYAMSVPQMPAQQLAPVYTAQTTYAGNSSYTTIQQQQNPGQGFADLGAALTNMARQKQAERLCMVSKGYTLQQK